MDFDLALITGAAGTVGGWVVAHLRSKKKAEAARQAAELKEKLDQASRDEAHRRLRATVRRATKSLKASVGRARRDLTDDLQAVVTRVDALEMDSRNHATKIAVLDEIRKTVDELRLQIPAGFSQLETRFSSLSSELGRLRGMLEGRS